MKIFPISRAATFALALGLPFAAQAQAPAQSPEPRAASAQTPPAAANPARRSQHLTQEQMMQRVETHLASLRTQLGITPAQDPQWQEFAKVTRDNAVAMRQRYTQRGTLLAQMSAADNMMDFAQISQQNAQERMKLATAFRGLYDVMSTEQKQRADQAFRTQHQPGQRPHRRP